MGKVYYFHYRREEFGYDDDDPFAVRLAPRGGMTFAYRLVSENQSLCQVEVDVGVAFCSIKDNYRKAEGRDIAEEMLTHKPLRLTVTYVLFDEQGRLNFGYLRDRLLDAACDDPTFDALVPRKFPIHEVI